MTAKKPRAAQAALAIIVLLCLCADLFIPYSPDYLDISHINQAPCGSFIFGTDSLGRDVFSMIWVGGRTSLSIALLSVLISTAIALAYGTLSGLAAPRLDDLLQRGVELCLSVPSILLVIFIQVILGRPTIISVALAIGLTSWMSISKVVRSEVLQLKDSAYVKLASFYGGGFFYLLRRHLLPNFWAAVMYMVVSNIAFAIAMEATLSFLGIGLPPDTVSWGSMLTQAQNSFLAANWWVVVIPGIFLIVTIVSIADIGNYYRRQNNSGDKQI